MYYLPLVLIPSLLIVLSARWFFKHRITNKEWAFQAGGLVISTLMGLLVLAAAGNGLSWDFNVVNGQVTGKKSVRVSCQHQYKCGETCHNETTRDSKGNVSTRRVCVPIYCDEHDYDIDWDVYTSVGTFTIDRINRQGTKEPPRWTKVEEGEPASAIRPVLNYLFLDSTRFKADPAVSERYKGTLFNYPDTFDYYRFNRVLSDNGKDYKDINRWLNNKLRLMGPKKQLNIILVVTRKGPDFYFAQMEAWRGARKNDVIIFTGVDENEKVVWNKAISFADGQSNQILLKELETMYYPDKQFNLELVTRWTNHIEQDFKRLPNSTFLYLKDGYVPPFWLGMTIMVFNLLATLGITFVFVREDF